MAKKWRLKVVEQKDESWYKNGVNMQEWLAISYFAPWFLIACLFAYKSFAKNNLSQADIDLFYILSWPTIISACFYYGVKLAVNLGMLRSKNKRSDNSVEDGQ